jgi:hypothetical protein
MNPNTAHVRGRFRKSIHGFQFQPSEFWDLEFTLIDSIGHDGNQVL